MNCSNVGSTNAVHYVSSLPCDPATAPSAALLPEPAPRVDIGDALNQLLQVSSQLSEQQVLTGKTQAESANAQREAAADARKEAVDRAAEAARQAQEAQEEGGLFSFITDNIGIIAVAAAAAVVTVATAGSGAPAAVAIIGLAISAGTEVAQKTGALEAVVGEEAANYVAMGGAVVGAAMTLGGSAASLASGASKIKAAADTFNAARSIAAGAAEIHQGVMGLEAAGHQQDADMANVDAKAQQQVMQRIEKLLGTILEDLREARQSSQKMTELVQGALQTNTQTLLQAGAMKV
jgi:hypothetical protein